MSRGITIRIDRANAIRIVGQIMREKTQQFNRDKSSYPQRLAQARRTILAALKALEVKAAKADGRELQVILDNHIITPWQKSRDLLPEEPVLNLCKENSILLMLQNDVRKVIPINSNHEIWALIQGKCEAIR